MLTIQNTPFGCLNSGRLSELCSFFPTDPGENPLFFDIETTGLSPKTSCICLIGVLWYEETEKKWKLLQWVTEKEEEEPALIRTFLNFSASFTCLIHYNGNRFDLPFLQARASLYGICPSFPPSYDLYEHLKPCSVLFRLYHRKQTDLEKLLHIERRWPDGKKCARLYLVWQSRRSSACQEAFLGHNQEDLISLSRLMELLSFLTFFRGDYICMDARLEEEQVFFTLRLPSSLPFSCTAGSSGFCLECGERHARVSFSMKEGRLRQYYENYRDYVYLPGEDTAVPRAIGDFLERGIKKPARPETCYTWFSVNAGFLQDQKNQLSFLQHTLPVMLNFL